MTVEIFVLQKKKELKLNFKNESCERNFKTKNINKIHVTTWPKLS